VTRFAAAPWEIQLRTGSQRRCSRCSRCDAFSYVLCKCTDVTAAADVSAQQHASTMIACSESDGWEALFCTGAALGPVPAPDVARLGLVVGHSERQTRTEGCSPVAVSPHSIVRPTPRTRRCNNVKLFTFPHPCFLHDKAQKSSV
jgi:hypothetical protein